MRIHKHINNQPCIQPISKIIQINYDSNIVMPQTQMHISLLSIYTQKGICHLLSINKDGCIYYSPMIKFCFIEDLAVFKLCITVGQPIEHSWTLYQYIIVLILSSFTSESRVQEN